MLSTGCASVPHLPCVLQRMHRKAAVDHGQTFSFDSVRASWTGFTSQIGVFFAAHVHISANVRSYTGIGTFHAHIIAQANRRWRTSRTVFQPAFVSFGIVGGEEGSYCYGGHHGYRYGGGGQGAGTRKRATGCRSRSCIVSWCVAGTITPLPHLVPYPQSVHPSEPLNSRVDILCIMPLSLLFYV